MVDIGHEHIALAEAKRLNITTFGMVDTNSDPNKIDFPIPANDDATKSIAIIVNYLTAAIAEGLEERQTSKDEETEEEATETSRGFEVEGGDAERERGGRGRGRGPGGPGASGPGAGGPGGGGAPGQRRRGTGGGPGGPGGGGARRPGGGR
jgi:small subunit ribosomal protein S2